MVDARPVTITLEPDELAVVLAALLLLERISFDDEPRLVRQKIDDATG